ncbi:MAG: mandelate racemase/muconate lactonizing enzyme family protein [Verrucomicrobiales bacterium]|nr:mandelate racemase/muconate lactonizing enzyme family protein [Verrucomicrobiales bacterium]
MPRITAIETVIPWDIMPNLLLVRLHTDAGWSGCGETYYTPHAVAALIHDWMAERLLGADALAVESHWRFLYERCTPFGHPGAEMRALSALDVALWDLLGQACGQPVYRLLGGPVRERIPYYNTCGGPGYGARETPPGAPPRHPGWPGYGDFGHAGPLQDNWSSQHAAGDLAEELLSEGISMLKMWPFDRAAHQQGGLHISHRDVEAAMRPLREIRDRVGMDIEIAIEGHAFFQLPAALRIAEALQEIRPIWLEDVLRVDHAGTLADFREKSGLPIAASEMLLGRKEYLSVLQARAADYVMIDPTWNGGISETRRVVDLAQAYNIPATMHDCTGPLTLFSGLHIAASSTQVVFQETVRAHIRTFYERLIETQPVLGREGIHLPEGPGLGTRLRDDLFQPGQREYRRSQF